MKLEEKADIIVIEGAGSPAEINLKDNDIVNMGLAEITGSNVLLAADIDRGGVFAQLLGTVELLTPDERARVVGMIINKFRGDPTILDPGIEMIEKKCGIPVMGVLPYLHASFDDEDSLTERFDAHRNAGVIDIAVIRYPRISNFTDFNVFEYMEGVSVRYVSSVRELGEPDMVFLPGSKNTMGDLRWMRESGLENAVKKVSERCPVFGICGGYQMLGQKISDPENAEDGGEIKGMGLLGTETVLKKEKIRKQVSGLLSFPAGVFEDMKDIRYTGYEIHMGVTTPEGLSVNSDGKNVYGSYIHGLFDEGDIAMKIVGKLAAKKGVEINTDDELSYASLKEKNYDMLADMIRENMDMDKVYAALSPAAI